MCQQEEVPDDSTFPRNDHAYHVTWESQDSLWFANHEREDQIFAQMITRSKARLCGHEEGEERVKGEDKGYEGGNTDEDINNFTLEPEDMEASPPQPQE